MAKTLKVRAPNRSFSGEVAGVVFSDGVGTLDLEADGAAQARAYFQRRGYGLGNQDPKVDVAADRAERVREHQQARAKARRAAPPVAPVDAREVAGPQVVGTALRDAAVEPSKGDFLPPINAGKADPHGPAVVAPEIHASGGPPGIRPGPVAVDDPPQQEAEEKAHAAAVIAVADPDSARNAEGDDQDGAPARNASRDAWAEYAVGRGMDPEEAELATRGELIERYGGTE